MSKNVEPRLNLITAISSSDREEQVAILLHSQGCNIIFRALNLDLLSTFLLPNKAIVCIIYSNNFLSSDQLKQLVSKYTQHRFIELSEKSDQQELLNQLAQVNRPPLVHQLARIQNLVAVFGSPASPGISTISNYLAILKSARIIASTHHNLRPQTLAKVDKIFSGELDKKLSTVGNELTIIDAGFTISLTKTLADRRGNAQWLSQSLGCSANFIYVINANDNGISYLSEFVSDFMKLINPAPIIYVLNQQRFDRQGRLIQNKFMDLVGKWPNSQIPFDRQTDRLQGETGNKHLFWRNSTFSKQIVKIGKQLV